MDWDVVDEGAGDNTKSAEELNPSRPMTELVKDTATLHKVLTRFYPPEKVQVRDKVMGPFFSFFFDAYLLIRYL